MQSLTPCAPGAQHRPSKTDPPAPGRFQHRIAHVCDFFYPSVGGIENHLFELSQHLIRLGHKAIIITHHHGKRRGVRYMTNGLKVYYVPCLPFVWGASSPTPYLALCLLFNILRRERITLVHGHQAFSTFTFVALEFAVLMGCRAVFTDHSLAKLDSFGTILINKLMALSIPSINHMIAVSHTARENTILRSCMLPYRCSVIPNAIMSDKFFPEVSLRDPNYTTIVTMSRLTYRKGVDLLLGVVPELCRQSPRVRFLIGGDGPMRRNLELMVDQHRLHQRVTLLGAVPHSHVPEILNRGDIFLNTSLTESFCIALLEATSVGLISVSTAVGGVPEVLPSDLVKLAPPTVKGILTALRQAMAQVKDVDAHMFHHRVRQMYSWTDVAKRTVRVYDQAMRTPLPSVGAILHSLLHGGLLVGLLYLVAVFSGFLIISLYILLVPTHQIDIAPDIPPYTHTALGTPGDAQPAEYITADVHALDAPPV